MKPFLMQHESGAQAVRRTVKNNVTAVRVKTYINEACEVEFYSYKTKWDGDPNTLREDFPLCLGSNQSVEEIDANDF